MTYLDDPDHHWVIEPAASDDPVEVLRELVTRLSPEGMRGYSWDPDIIAALAAVEPLCSDLLDALVNPPEGTSLLDAFNTLLAALRLSPITDDDGHAEERDLVLRGAHGLHTRGAGTPTQCLDTALTWYYG
jgi:hypothetical protein